jgi:hypothetical protein
MVVMVGMHITRRVMMRSFVARIGGVNHIHVAFFSGRHFALRLE